jgi:glucose-6-phosphate isomerase
LGNSMDIHDEFFIDVKNLFGNTWSVTEKALATYGPCIKQAARDVSELRRTGKGPDGSQVLFPHLPYLLKEEVLISREEREALLRLREEAKSYDAVISIGIGGSYLGNQVLFDLFCGPYWNQLTKEERGGYPQFYFAGQNVDPVTLVELSSCISREAKRLKDRRMKVLFLVISKSGTTIEPVTAVRGLKKLLVDVCDIHLMAITDKEKGRIRPLAEERHFPCFTVPDGIGGRFSIFS